MEFSFTSTQIMYIIFAFLVSLVISFATTPLASVIARRVGAIDVPNARRVNKKPIPRMGGLAIYYGFLVTALCFVDISSMEIRGILLGSVIIVLLGALDDVYQLKAMAKFIVQILVALLVVAHGVEIDVLTNPNPFGASEYINLGYWGIPLTVLWIVGVTNAVNLMDGLDGLAVGISTIASIALFIIAVFTGEANIAILIIAVVGACLGFLPFNAHPAKIFMGDTGSTFLGYIMATVSIQGLFKGYAVISLAVPLLILGLPIFDTSVTILRRIHNKQPVFKPDRGHLHHKLMDSGFSHKQTVFILYVVSALTSLCAVTLLLLGSARALILIFAIIIFVLVALLFAGNNLFGRNVPDERPDAENKKGVREDKVAHAAADEAGKTEASQAESEKPEDAGETEE